VTAPGNEAMQERLVTLEVLVREVLRRLDAEVTPRHSDHEARIRVAESLLSEIRVRVALISGGGGILGGVATAVLAHFLGAA
jgi:1-deoxy-D-xylulose 5-phosphate reductoisomerase